MKKPFKFFKAIPIEIPEGIPTGFPERMLGRISDRILRGISAGSSVPEIITEEIPGGIIVQFPRGTPEKLPRSQQGTRHEFLKEFH